MPDSKKINLWQTIALAVGTMIGASIFSIFGLGARIAGSNLPLVFLISGLIALFVAYSYALLGKRIISNAGPMEFILRGIGDNLITGSLSFLSGSVMLSPLPCLPKVLPVICCRSSTCRQMPLTWDLPSWQ